MKTLIFGIFISLCGSAHAVEKPNIILILADDQGWNGLSVPMDPDVTGSKSDFYETPHLARLAGEGMRFSQGYAPAPVCSPTRHSIQFGISPAKTRVTYNNYATKQHCDPELSLANLIKKADSRYATAHIGKWHVSVEPALCGYDVSDGSTANKEGDTSHDPEDPKRVYGVSQRAVEFMENAVAESKPFFLQVSHYADHLKFKSSPAMLAKYQAMTPGERHTDPVFAGMNGDLDAGVGQIMDAVEQLGIKDNTYIFYTADNGFDQSNDHLHGVAERKAWPLAYSKGFVFEGGVRVPFIVSGPGIEPNSVSRVPVVGYDLMATFLELIAPDFTVPEITEGGSLVSVLKNAGKGKINRPNDFIVFHYPNGVWPSQTSLIKGNYKIVKTWAFDRVEMFDLRTDLSEQKDLSQQLPEKAEKLHAAMTDYLERVNAVTPTEEELANDRNGLLMKKGAPQKKGNKQK
ncbi:MAG: sulfatase-like hydrolase/transferase [Verrucomicrobiota bacterium]